MGILQKISNIALKPSVAIGNLITSGLEKVTGKDYSRTTSQELSSTPMGKALGTAIAGTGAALIAVVAPTIPSVAAATKAVGSKVVSVAKANPIKTAILTPVIVGAVASQPEKAAQAVVNAPLNLGNVGANIANLAAEPSFENLKELVTENPVIVGTAVAAGTALGVKGIAQAAATYSQTQATKELTEAISEKETINYYPAGQYLPQVDKEEAQVTPLSQVTTPIEETYSIAGTTKTSTKKRKKKALEPRRQTISQRVNVNVGVDNRKVENKKYIKNTILIPA